MFGLSRGELGIVLFIFGLVWGAGQLPKLGEHLAVRLAKRPPRDAKGA
jgi:Sec-independent protein translocase protein TatA